MILGRAAIIMVVAIAVVVIVVVITVTIAVMQTTHFHRGRLFGVATIHHINVHLILDGDGTCKSEERKIKMSK